MTQGRLSPQILAKFAAERDVISYAPGFDQMGRSFVLKLVVKNGQENVVFMPPAIAFHIRNSIRDASRKHRYRDVRRKVGEFRPEPRIIKQFLERQPTIAGNDWDALAGPVPRVAKGCEIHAFKDSVFLGFVMSEDVYQIFRFRPAISFYLPEMVDDAERASVMVDLQKAPVPSPHRQ